MNATKILWGQVFAVSTAVLVFVWAATEWTAWRLAFQPQLGQNSAVGFASRSLLSRDFT